MVLADFPDYQHISDSQEISTQFFDTVARYFNNVSYGKLTIIGNVTDWIRLPKLYSQYGATDLQASVVNAATDAFYLASRSFNITGFDYVLLVLSFYPSLTGDFVSNHNHPISTKTGVVTDFAVVEEDRDWSDYAHAFALLLGLWHFQVQLSGMGTNDLAASGTGELSTWSRAAMGWVNRSQVLSVKTPVANRILVLDPPENPGADALALQINLGANAGEYWIEVRQPLGYDRSNLQEYGAIVNYISSSDAPIQFEKVLQPDVTSKATFVDPDADLSIIALNVTEGKYMLLVGNAQSGREAQSAVYAMSRAQDVIQAAEAESRFENLDLAQELLVHAHQLFDLGKFSDASAMAISAETTASTATASPEYSQAVQLLKVAETLKNGTATAGSSQSSLLIQQANAQLDNARQAFNARDFASAKQAAQLAIDLYNRAKQTERYDTIVSLLSNLVLIIPVIILAFALRYQLKPT